MKKEILPNVCERTQCKSCNKKDCIWKPQTNADRIRTMIDEELADEIFYILNHVLWMYNDSRLGLLDWLKQEAD